MKKEENRMTTSPKWTTANYKRQSPTRKKNHKQTMTKMAREILFVLNRHKCLFNKENKKR